MNQFNSFGADCSAWTMIDTRYGLDALGYVPMFLSDADPAPAARQFEKNYPFGGWDPQKAWVMLKDGSLKYPGDPALRPIAERRLRDERIVMYPGAVFAIIQTSGSFEAARID